VPSIAIVLLAALTLAVPGRAAAASTTHDRWRRPLPGAAVVRAFSFDPAAPYARGRRRGIELRARPGTPVLAACAGTVTHAGRVPRWGPGVTLRCGRLVATELGLASLAVHRGAHVSSGGVLGQVGPRGVLRLGARRATGRQAYLDPLTLLAADPRGPASPPAVAPPPRGRRVRARPRPPSRRVSTPVADPAPLALPWPVWAGVGLLAAGAAGGTTARARRRRRPPATSTALAHRYR
jgi:hypothetical protein